jgi:GNAT superfamily N-acetyltransferase
MHIESASSKKTIRQFALLPYRIYKDDSVWVAPLRVEVLAQFNPQKNPTLEHCEYQLFLLRDGKEIIGRIAAFIDRLAVDYWGEAIGMFGYFECPEDKQAADLLLDAARQWLKEKGTRRMRGPWSFVSQEWGSVLEGFTPEPVIMSPYNPPFYNDFYTDFGLEKVKDLLIYYIDAREGYQIPERILTLTDRVAQRYGIRTRLIRMDRFDEEVRIFMEMSNTSLAHNWGYAPVTEAEASAMAKDLKTILHKRAVVFAEDKAGRPVGFAVALPDVNKLLKGLNGRLFPVGIFKLLFGLPHLNQYRMFALGVIPEYHGKAVDSLLYRALYESCYNPDIRMEINYVLEDNGPMINAILKLGAKPLRRYRIYEMGL